MLHYCFEWSLLYHKDLFLLFYKTFVVLQHTAVILHLSLSSCLLSIDLMISRILHFTINGRMTCENNEIKSIFLFHEIIQKNFIEFLSTLNVFPFILSCVCYTLIFLYIYMHIYHLKYKYNLVNLYNFTCMCAFMGN